MIWLLFWTYFKIGLFTIGGGYAMLPMVIKEVVEKHNWLSEIQLMEFISIAESTPGPFAINLATFVGNSQAGIIGGMIATFAVVLPSLIITTIVAASFNRVRKSKIFERAMWGLRPIVVGLVASAAYTIILVAVKENEVINIANIAMVIIFAVISRIKINGKKINPILLIASSAVVGLVVFGFFGLA